MQAQGQDRERSAPRGAPRSVTGRAVIIGVLAAAAWAAISAYSDQYTGLTWGFGWGSLPVGPVVLAFVIVAVNGLVLRLRPARALTLADVVVIYALLTISAAVIVVYVPYGLPIGAYSFYHARVEPGWESTILPHLPVWLHPSDPQRIVWFWEGLPRGESLPWHDWLFPTAAWGSLAVAMLASMLCLGSLLRKDWIESQRLAFPLTEVPLALVGDSARPTLGSGAFRQRAFWVGLVLAGTMTLLVWLNQLVPAVPAPVLVSRVGEAFDGAGLPLSVLNFVVVRIQPATIGLLCLIPVEVSFSLWFFYALFLGFLVVCGSLGIPPQGSAAIGSFNPRAFADYASVGGFIAVSAMALYHSRGAFQAGFRSLLRRHPESPDPVAPMTNRAALLGFLLANVFMFWWALHAGMSWWSFALIMAAFYVAAIGTSRLVAQAGLLQARPAVSTRWMVLRTVGAGAFDPRSLAMYSYLTMGYMLEPQNLGLNYLINSFKLNHARRISGRGFPTAVFLTVLATLAAGAAGLIYTSYRYGAVSMQCWPITAVPTCAFREFSTSLISPEKGDNLLRLALLVGAAFTLGLFWLSSRFVWWPLAPIGFIVASVWHTNQHVWTNALIAWTIVTLVRRYGGLRLYRTLHPAFLGLVLGQYLIDAAMALVAGGLLGVRGLSSVSR